MRNVPALLERERNVHVFNHQYFPGFEQEYLLISDVHWDNPKCDRKLLKKHLDQAKERNAGILIIGDLFCAMQGAYDPRKSKSDILPEHNKANYLDALVTTAAEYFAPYADNLKLVTPGNHETAILKRQETNLTDRFVQAVNLIAKPQTPVCVGGYSGFVRFAFSRNNSNRLSKRLFYHHGFGGGGPVTKGVIQTNRRAAFVQADIIISGHIHEAWEVENIQTRLTAADKIILEEQLHLCMATYKEEYNDGYGGFHIEKGRPPKPLGGWWLKFYYEEDTIKMTRQRAK